MSRIYDALIKLEKKQRANSRSDFAENWTSNRSEPVYLRWKAVSAEHKLVGTVAGLTLVFGFLLLVVVHQLTSRALQSQIHQRALVAAINLSDAAAGHVLGRNRLELHVLVTKYTRLDGSAYAFIEDHKGQIVAHTLPTFPPELAETLTLSERRQVARRVVGFQGKTVYETRAPILEGQVGTARIGVWQESVATEINNALLPIVGIVAGLILAGVILALFFAHGIFRWPAMAGRMSGGELSAVGSQFTE